MLFEIPKKCVLIFVINVALNSFAQNLHLRSQNFPCFIDKDTHLITNHYRALERGHGLVCLLAIEEELLGLTLEEELLKDIFNIREEILSPSKCLQYNILK
jgi:hypothetical protein